MITNKTVFVVGAGASREVDLPVGDRLKKLIADKLDIQLEYGPRLVKGDPIIYEALQNRFGANRMNAIVDACRSISSGLFLANSIDDYIDMHQDDQAISLCGKIAIAKCILEAERKSKLFFERKHVDDTINFGGIENTWYAKFFVLLTQQVQRQNLDSIFENVTIITFNYDRCIEHFLVHAIAQLYRTSVEEARERVAQLSIFHVYGSVGKYFGNSHEISEFGKIGLPKIDTITTDIRTYCERIEDESTVKNMHAAIAAARRLVFLGTAFHQLNMALITPPSCRGVDRQYDSKELFATRFGFTKDEDLLTVCHKHLIYLAGTSFQSNIPALGFKFSQECHDLFSDYHHSLRR